MYFCVCFQCVSQLHIMLVVVSLYKTDLGVRAAFVSEMSVMSRICFHAVSILYNHCIFFNFFLDSS